MHSLEYQKDANFIAIYILHKAITLKMKAS